MTITTLAPSPGSRGTYRLKAPFDTKIVEDMQYTCQSVRTFQEILASGEDPKLIYYLVNNLTDQDYIRDVNDGVVMVSLSSDDGKWIFVPSSYIEQWPTIDGVPYNVIGLMVVLGSLADTVDLSNLKTRIENLVTGILGLTPEIETVNLSTTVIKTLSEHQSYEQARQNNIDDLETDLAVRLRVEGELTRARQHITILEEYLIANHTP